MQSLGDWIKKFGSSRNGETVAFCVLGLEWGSNGDHRRKPFVCNIVLWGYVGMNPVSPLEMGIEGGGRVSKIPRLQRDRATRRPKLNLNH